MRKTQKSLRKWTKQEWGTKSGKPSTHGSQATGERYLPKKAREALSDKEYAATTRKKREDTKKGKQHSKQPKKIAKKVNWEGEFTFDLSRPDGVRAKTVDGTYGKKILGWEPQVDLDTGIAKTVEWYMEENG